MTASQQGPDGAEASEARRDLDVTGYGLPHPRPQVDRSAAAVSEEQSGVTLTPCDAKEPTMNPQLIPTVPLFSSVRRRDRQTIARLADTVDVPAGKTLTREGELADAFFVILDGMAVASRAGEPVAILGPGDYFGEIGLLDGRLRRTATVTAETPMGLVVVARREFASIVDEFPAIREELEEAAAVRFEGSTRLAA